jgi:hypothetical protein
VLGVIFGSKNNSKIGVPFNSYVPGCSNNGTAVDVEKIPNSQSPIIFGLTDVIPGSEVKGGRNIIFLNVSPPKSSND